MKRKNCILIIIIIILAILFVASICLGSINISIKEIFNILFGKEYSKSSWYIIKRMRFPRSIGAILIGAGLACSGLIFQAVFKNPMADSYMLGISSSASFSVCLSFLFLKNINSSYAISIFAFTGSILCTLFLFFTSRKNNLKLLLTGISLNFFFSAATTLLIYLNRKQLDSILFWTMGSLASLDWMKILILSIVIVITIIITVRERYSLDLLLLNDDTARSSGVNLEQKRIKMLIVATISTSVIVSFCGVIGFIGMLASHVIRLVLGPKHSKIIIPSVLLGSIILLMSDIISRTIIAPSELPIGVISSVLGAPVLFILIRRKKSWMQY